MKKRVLIIGGGIGGTMTANHLVRKLYPEISSGGRDHHDALQLSLALLQTRVHVRSIQYVSRARTQAETAKPAEA